VSQEIPLSEVIGQLGMLWSYNEGDIITDLVIIGKVASTQGMPSVLVTTSPGCDVVTQLGLIESAKAIATKTWETKHDE
jgi:4-aminobutyrate aminotransferase-like enzyme